MVVRRSFFVWQFVAAVMLPVWLLVGYSVHGSGVGGLLGVLLLAPIVLVVEVALALLFSARVGIRRSRALDWPAVGALAAFQAGVIGVGFFGPVSALFGALAFVAAVGGFWLSVTLLVEDTRRRVRATFAQFQDPYRDRTPIDRGEYVVVKPSA